MSFRGPHPDAFHALGEEEVFRSLQAGARGYILKSAIREELLRAIREVYADRRYLDPAVAPL